MGGEIIKIYRLSDNGLNVNGQLVDEITSILINDDRSSGLDHLMEHFLNKTQAQFKELSKEDFLGDNLEANSSITIVVSKYYPRNLKVHQNSWELIVLGKP